MEYGVQFASFLFLLTIVFNYFRHKRLPLQSTHFFTAFILLSLLSLIFEGFTLLTINNIESVDGWVNRLTHQLFIASINLIILMLFLYIDLKCRGQRKYKKWEIIIRLFPMVVSFGFIIFGKLHYHIENDGRYSYGMMANTIYICVFLYIILTIIDLIRNRCRFSKQEIISISLGILSWCSVSLVQFFNPTWLLSSIAIVLMVNFLFISFENTEKYLVNKEGCVFSKNAFELTTREYLNKKDGFFVINVTITNYDLISHEFGIDEASKILNKFASESSKDIKGTIFMIKDNCFSIVTDDSLEYFKLTNLVNVIFPFQYENKNIKLKLFKKGIDGSKYNSFEDLITDLDTIEDKVTVFKENKTYSIPIKEVYYIEVIDSQTFIYTKKDCFESKEKLYQLEELLIHWNFIRCSKSMLCNIQKIVSTEKESNSRLVVYLTNGESIIVSRQYVKDFKAKVKI